MLGLTYRSFENFIRHTYGGDQWVSVTNRIDAAPEAFEPLFRYADTLAGEIVTETAAQLGKPEHVLLEDFGTFLVANPNSEHVRRLLRFGGVDYQDFLHSLEDLRGRANLALPELDLPELELKEVAENSYAVSCIQSYSGFGHILLGVLRALADDYGTLAILDCGCGQKMVEQGSCDGSDGQACCDTITVHLVDLSHAEAKDFQLSAEVS